MKDNNKDKGEESVPCIPKEEALGNQEITNRGYGGGREMKEPISFEKVPLKK